MAALTLQSRINEKYDPCRNFKQFSCSSENSAPTLFKYNNKSSMGVRSNQEAVHLEMLQLLTETATDGPFRKLSRLYESCLRQTVQLPSVKLLMEELGGYLAEGTIGPESLTQIISKIAQRGPNPLIGTYFDLSYGRNPKIMLIIDQPTNSAPVLEVSKEDEGDRGLLLISLVITELRALDGTKDTADKKQIGHTRATR